MFQSSMKIENILLYSKRVVSRWTEVQNFPKICTKLANSGMSFQEVLIPVPWGHIAGKWWGPTNKRPVLTMHGWQDNCGSFNRLIPLLDIDLAFLAIDYPGHGYSSKIPSGQYCYFTNYLILVRYLAKYFQWPKVSLMGHSMGAVVSYMYAMAYPDDVDFLICIEAAKPVALDNHVERIAKAIAKFVKIEQINTEPPSYTMEEIKQRMCQLNKSVTYENCHHLIERNVAPSKLDKEKFYFTRDLRLKQQNVIGLFNLPQEDVLTDSSNIKCPIFIGRATGGNYYEPMEKFYEVLDVLKKVSLDCVYEKFEGTHHYHLNNPEKLAESLTQFIKKHDVEDRSIGGIKEEIKLK